MLEAAPPEGIWSARRRGTCHATMRIATAALRKMRGSDFFSGKFISLLHSIPILKFSQHSPVVRSNQRTRSLDYERRSKSGWNNTTTAEYSHGWKAPANFPISEKCFECDRGL